MPKPTQGPAAGAERPDPITLRDKCLTCAFRPGTEASKSPNTLWKARLCATTGEHFVCHEHNPEIGVVHEQVVLCKGWLDLFANNMRAGKLLDGWKLDLTRALTDVICEVEATPEKYRTEEAIQTLIHSKIEAVDAMQPTSKPAASEVG